MSDILKNIITFGGHSKIKEANEELGIEIRMLKRVNDRQTLLKKDVNNHLETITEVKGKAVKNISKIKRITKLISLKDRNLIEQHLEQKTYSLKNIEKNIEISEHLLNLGGNSFKAIAISGLSVSATWSVVGALGTATTGTALSTLSGAAATNATLAWFGGGAISSGGLGMAGGTIVLGSLVVIPAIIITGLLQYKNSLNKVKEIHKKKIQTIENIDLIRKNILAMEVIIKRTNEVERSLKKSMKAFNYIYIKTYWKIYKFGFISKIYKNIRKKYFNKPYFTETDIKHIAFLGKCTSDIMKIIDTKII